MNNKLNKKMGVIVCEHIVKGKPIQSAMRTEPVFPEDSGWQFTCGESTAEDENRASIWTIEELLNIEPSLQPFLKLPFNCKIVRTNKPQIWTIIEENFSD